MATKRKDPEEAEKHLIGSILKNPKKNLEYCVDMGLTADALCQGRPCASILKAMLELREHKRDIDIVSIIELLDSSGEIARSGGPDGISDIMTLVPSGAGLETYLAIVMKNAAVRTAKAELKEISDKLDLCHYGDDVLTVLAGSFKKPVGFVTPRVSADDDRSLLTAYVNAVEERANGSRQTVFSTPFETLNRKAGGTGAGEVTGILGLPSSGKSILGKQMALHNLIEHNMPTMIVTGEMPYQQWMDRAVCELGNINFQNFRNGRLHEYEQKSLINTIARIAKLPLYVYDRKRLRMERGHVEAAVRREAKNHGIKCLLVDYLQLIKPPSNSKKELRTDQEIGEVSNMLKDVSVNFGLHTLALCAESDEGKIRNSREPEYDFDNIIKLIVRTEKNPKTGNPMIITDKVLVTKWRDSERGYTMRVEMEGQHCRFRDVTGPSV